jgi:hypothetical protein
MVLSSPAFIETRRLASVNGQPARVDRRPGAELARHSDCRGPPQAPVVQRFRLDRSLAAMAVGCVLNKGVRGTLLFSSLELSAVKERGRSLVLQ